MLNDLLVGGAITILKNMKVNGKDDGWHPIYYGKKMFQTTNQYIWWPTADIIVKYCYITLSQMER